MLVEGARVAQSEHLHPEADAQDGDVWLIVEFVDELGFEGLAVIEDGRDGVVCGTAEGFGFGVIAAGEDEGIEVLDEIGDIARRRGEDDWDAAGVDDGLGVGHGEVGGRAIVTDHQI